MANLTLVLTPNNKWIVFDTLMSIECSRAAIEFADRWFNENGYPEVEGILQESLSVIPMSIILVAYAVCLKTSK